MTTRNARFWDYVNTSRVKLTLRPGQALTWSKWERTDEGWSSEGCTWSHDGAGVRCQYGSDGVDCDGRLRQGGELYAPLAALHAGRTVDDVTYPAWEKVESWQRDYRAEAAGY
jgi:hypothetical protein